MAPKPFRLWKRGNIWWHRVMVPRWLRAITGKRELTRSLRTSDLSKARRLAAIEDARCQAWIDRAQRQFDAQKADIVDLTESEAWSLAVEWLLENEKRTPVDRTPQEHVEEALFSIAGIAGDEDQETAREEADKWLWRQGIGEVTPASYQRFVNFIAQALIEYEKRC